MSQKLLPGSQDTQEQWGRGEKDHRTHQEKMLSCAYRERHKGTLNFSAYLQAKDACYLGLIPTQPRPTYYGRSFGNDSSNVQSILNGPAYWSRIYYRPDDPFADALAGLDSPKEPPQRPGSGRPGSSQGRLSRPASAGSLGRPSSSGSGSSVGSAFSRGVRVPQSVTEMLIAEAASPYSSAFDFSPCSRPAAEAPAAFPQAKQRPSSAPLARTGSAPALQGGRKSNSHRRPTSAQVPRLRKLPLLPRPPSSESGGGPGGAPWPRPSKGDRDDAEVVATTAEAAAALPPRIPRMTSEKMVGTVSSRTEECLAEEDVMAAVSGGGAALAQDSASALLGSGGAELSAVPHHGERQQQVQQQQEQSRPALADLTNKNEPADTNAKIEAASKAPKPFEHLRGYPRIKASMESYVLYGGKPRVRLKSRGDRSTFFNTLESKYGVTWGGERRVFDYDRCGHRSSRAELTFIASNGIRRKDWQTVLVEENSDNNQPGLIA